MHRLLSLVKEETDESLRLIATHYARDFEFSHFAGRNFVVNSDLLAKSLSQDHNVLLVLATGVEAYDTIKRKVSRSKHPLFISLSCKPVEIN